MIFLANRVFGDKALKKGAVPKWRWPESNRRPKVIWPGPYKLNRDYIVGLKLLPDEIITGLAPLLFHPARTEQAVQG